MTKYEKIKNMTIEEMAADRVKWGSKITGHSNADNEDYYDYWYETSDGKHFSRDEIGNRQAIDHEKGILNREY